MDKKTRKQEVKRLGVNQKVIDERIELLKEVVSEMERSGGMPSIPLGGLFDDLIKLNPYRAEVIVPMLLQEFEKEADEVKALIANLN